MSGDAAIPKGPDGTARLFPLPNVVLFPQVLLPLHIFEPRYRQMTADALAGDRLIAMALLRPGWEPEYEGRPALYPVVCLGQIIADNLLDDGCSNLLLRGLARARLLEEVPTNRLYRSARLEALVERPVPTGQTERRYRRELVLRAKAWAAAVGQSSARFQALLTSDLPLGVLGDILAFSLPLPIEVKQELLTEPDVEARIPRLLTSLESPPPSPSADSEGARFPPEFSPN